MTEFEFDSTPETDAMLKQLCIKECFVRCKDCKYWEKEYDEYDGEEWWTCGKYEPYNSNDSMHEDDFCSRGERKDD